MDPAGQRVTYIPEVVKNEMRDQIQQELMAQAREENWGANKTEDWTSRLIPFGDIRLRSENIFFEDGNNNTGAFPNFAVSTAAHPSTPPAPSSPHNTTSIKIVTALAYVLALVLKFYSERDSTLASASQPVIQILQPHPTKLSVVAKAISRNTICG